MTGRSRTRRHLGTATAALAAGCGLLLAATACAASRGTANAAGTQVTNVPLASSISTTAASWVAVPMGRLRDPLNTFWQLFVLPVAKSHWSLVTPRGMADNGGLVAAIGGSRSALIGVRASGDLHFSTVNRTADLGRSYTVGALPTGLENHPDALAVGPGDKAFAIVGPNDRLLSSSGGLSSWSSVLTRNAAKLQVTKPCQPRTVDAVAVTASGQPLVGATCTRPGAAGLYAASGKSLHPVGLELPAAFAHATFAVLRLDTVGSKTLALLLAANHGHRTLLAASASGTGSRWQTGPSLALRPGQRIVSLSATASGYGALLSTASGRPGFVEQVGAGWRRYPAPPAGTAAVAIPAGQPAQAITVHESTFNAWTFDSATHRWRHTQSISVPIQYGSSG